MISNRGLIEADTLCASRDKIKHAKQVIRNLPNNIFISFRKNI